MGNRTKCLDCGASRGLAEYDNGTYCFGCQKATVCKSLQKRLDTQIKKPELELPDNKDVIFPKEVYDWLFKYFGLETNNLHTKGIFWSEKYKRIIFPIYGIPYGLNSWETNPQMLAAWMRSVNEQPKWLFAGDKDVVFKYGDWYNNYSSSYVNDSSVCIVEDVVSAVKVSEVMDSIALGGTNLKEIHYDYLRSHPYRNVYIFLDGDEAGKKGAQRVRNELKLQHTCVIIREKLDPKEIPINGLEELLK